MSRRPAPNITFRVNHYKNGVIDHYEEYNTGPDARICIKVPKGQPGSISSGYNISATYNDTGYTGSLYLNSYFEPGTTHEAWIYWQELYVICSTHDLCGWAQQGSVTVKNHAGTWYTFQGGSRQFGIFGALNGINGSATGETTWIPHNNIGPLKIDVNTSGAFTDQVIISGVFQKQWHQCLAIGTGVKRGLAPAGQQNSSASCNWTPTLIPTEEGPPGCMPGYMWVKYRYEDLVGEVYAILIQHEGEYYDCYDAFFPVGGTSMRYECGANPGGFWG
ncbi:hypothetical protein TA3x_004283 [Tundrisphaera sp. TA3]|uniref:hypothetical protein n=1 Tax=Tundrisphaera sp. TA3 TaxID=3435775 RepID=UPI003EBCDC03